MLRAVRRFDGRPLEQAQLNAILDAGRRAPSSSNDQTREFIVCTDRQHLAELSTLGDWTAHLEGAAAGIAVITPDPEDPEEREIIAFRNAGIVALTATDDGPLPTGTVWTVAISSISIMETVFSPSLAV